MTTIAIFCQFITFVSKISQVLNWSKLAMHLSHFSSIKPWISKNPQLGQHGFFLLGPLVFNNIIGYQLFLPCLFHHHLDPNFTYQLIFMLKANAIIGTFLHHMCCCNEVHFVINNQYSYMHVGPNINPLKGKTIEIT